MVETRVKKRLGGGDIDQPAAVKDLSDQRVSADCRAKFGWHFHPLGFDPMPQQTVRH
jgi:hypothetical protein